MRIGEIELIVDSDMVVPEDCLRDAAREMREYFKMCVFPSFLLHFDG